MSYEQQNSNNPVLSEAIENLVIQSRVDDACKALLSEIKSQPENKAFIESSIKKLKIAGNRGAEVFNQTLSQVTSKLEVLEAPSLSSLKSIGKNVILSAQEKLGSVPKPVKKGLVALGSFALFQLSGFGVNSALAQEAKGLEALQAGAQPTQVTLAGLNEDVNSSRKVGGASNLLGSKDVAQTPINEQSTQPAPAEITAEPPQPPVQEAAQAPAIEETVPEATFGGEVSQADQTPIDTNSRPELSQQQQAALIDSATETNTQRSQEYGGIPALDLQNNTDSNSVNTSIAETEIAPAEESTAAETEYVDEGYSSVSPVAIPDIPTSAALGARLETGSALRELSADDANELLAGLNTQFEEISQQGSQSIQRIAEAASTGNALPSDLDGVQLVGGIDSNQIYQQFLNDQELARDVAQDSTATISLNNLQINQKKSASGLVLPIPSVVFAFNFQTKERTRFYVAGDDTLTLHGSNIGVDVDDSSSSLNFDSVDDSSTLKIEDGNVISESTIGLVRVARTEDGKSYLYTQDAQVEISTQEAQEIENGTISESDAVRMIIRDNPNSVLAQGAIEYRGVTPYQPILIGEGSNTYDLYDTIAAASSYAPETADASGTRITNRNSIVNRDVLAYGVNLFKHLEPNQKRQFAADLVAFNQLDPNQINYSNPRHLVLEGLTTAMRNQDSDFFNRGVILPSDIENITRGLSFDALDPLTRASDGRQRFVYRRAAQLLNNYPVPLNSSIEDVARATSSLRRQLERSGEYTKGQLDDMFNPQLDQEEIAKIEALEKAAGQSSTFSSQSRNRIDIGLGGIGSTRTTEISYRTADGLGEAEVDQRTRELLNAPGVRSEVDRLSTVLGIPLNNIYINPTAAKGINFILGKIGSPVGFAGGSTTSIESNSRFYGQSIETAGEFTYLADIIADSERQARQESRVEGGRNNTGETPEAAFIRSINKGRTGDNTYFLEYNNAAGDTVRREFSTREERDGEIQKAAALRQRLIIQGNQLSNQASRTTSDVNLVRGVRFETQTEFNGDVITAADTNELAQTLNQLGQRSTGSFQQRFYKVLSEFDTTFNPEIFEGETVSVTGDDYINAIGQIPVGVGAFGNGLGKVEAVPFIGVGETRMTVPAEQWEDFKSGVISEAEAYLDKCENIIKLVRGENGEIIIQTEQQGELDSTTILQNAWEAIQVKKEESNLSGFLRPGAPDEPQRESEPEPKPDPQPEPQPEPEQVEVQEAALQEPTPANQPTIKTPTPEAQTATPQPEAVPTPAPTTPQVITPETTPVSDVITTETGLPTAPTPGNKFGSFKYPNPANADVTSTIVDLTAPNPVTINPGSTEAVSPLLSGIRESGPGVIPDPEIPLINIQ